MRLTLVRGLRGVRALLVCGVLVYSGSHSGTAAESSADTQLRAAAERVHTAADAVPHTVATLTASVVDANNLIQDLEVELSGTAMPPPVYGDFLEGARKRIGKAEVPEDVRTELRRVADRLDAMAQGIPPVAELPNADVQVRQVRQHLRAELASGDYTQDTALNNVLWWAAWTRFVDWWDDLFDMDMLEGLGRGSFYIMVGLLILTAGALIYVYARAFVRRRGRIAAREAQTELDTVRMADPLEYATEAERCAQAGRYREALRYEFLRMLAEFERLKLVAYDRTRTNSEYVQQLRRTVREQELVRTFTALTRSFNRAWYGHEQCTVETYRQFSRSAAEAIHHAVRVS